MLDRGVGGQEEGVVHDVFAGLRDLGLGEWAVD